MRIPAHAIALLALAAPAYAQHDGHRPGAGVSPYAGFEAREIKAVAPQELADLRAGRGMGLALAAELNGYPGPMHALEHADALRLMPAQREALTALMAGMRRDAVAAGEQLIEAERALDRLFAERRATDAAVGEATARIGLAAAAVRTAHLVTHVATRALLTEAQLTHYDTLRGHKRHG